MLRKPYSELLIYEYLQNESLLDLFCPKMYIKAVAICDNYVSHGIDNNTAAKKAVNIVLK